MNTQIEYKKWLRASSISSEAVSNELGKIDTLINELQERRKKLMRHASRKFQIYKDQDRISITYPNGYSEILDIVGAPHIELSIVGYEIIYPVRPILKDGSKSKGAIRKLYQSDFLKSEHSLIKLNQ